MGNRTGRGRVDMAHWSHVQVACGCRCLYAWQGFSKPTAMVSEFNSACLNARERRHVQLSDIDWSRVGAAYCMALAAGKRGGNA